MQSEIAASWREIQTFLAGNPTPGNRKALPCGEMRYSMGMPRYFLDRPFMFDEAGLARLNALTEQYGLRQDVREPPGNGAGNIVLFDRDGVYLGRLTTTGLTLTPQRFTEALFAAILGLYLDHA